MVSFPRIDILLLLQQLVGVIVITSYKVTWYRWIL